jgi:hypothetical protein
VPIAFADAPIPLQDPIARQAREGQENDKLAGYLTDPWVEWLNLLSSQVGASAFISNTVSLTAQGASIAPTDYSGGGLSAGLYRLTYYTRITRAATTSSSLTVTLGWTESTVSLTISGSAITGNTVTTGQSGTIMVRIDAASPVTYSTTYASVGGVSMQYRTDFVLEQLKIGAV